MRPQLRPVLVLVFAVAVVVAIVAIVSSLDWRPAPSSSPGLAAATTSSATGVGTVSPSPVALGHVYVIVMENEEASSILGNPDAPFLNSLASANAIAMRYTGVAHPSQPNYLALFSGSTQGVTDDRDHTITGASTIADQIESAGRDWHLAAENVPSDCFTSSTASGGPDGEGDYVRKHNPAITFEQIASNPQRCARITDFSHFDPALGDYWLIVPNLCHDMHDCSIATGDAFLADFVPRFLDSPAFTSDGVLFVTFDEGTSDTGGGGSVVTLVVGPHAEAGARSDASYNHYSLLRTIEDGWSLPCLGHACDARPMTDLLR